MDIRVSFVATALAGSLVAASASPDQREAHRPAPGAAQAQAQVAQCTQAQPRVASALEAALKRLDDARQTNSPAVMRAAADDVQAALLDVRAQLTPCAEMQVAVVEPHVGHAMPNREQAPAAAPGAPVLQPGSTVPAPAAARQIQRAQERAPDRLMIAFRTIPSPPRGAAENEFEVTVRDSQSKPIDGADVSLVLYMAAMPAINMPEMRNEMKLTGIGGGKYSGKGQVVMAGPWTVTVSVKQNGREVGQERVAVTAR